MTARVAGKVVVVTGAAGGQGAVEALALAKDGAIVIAVDLADQPGIDLAGVEYRRLDVTDAAGWKALAQHLHGRHGRVDGLVNNAGVTWRARLAELQLSDLRRVLDVNVSGPLLGIQHLSPLMPRGSSIVNIGSVAALSGHYALAYTTSKWALRGLSHSCALELGPAGIRVNLVHPGFIETSMTASAPAAFRDSNLAAAPLQRAGTPADIAPLIVHLISDESAFTTGAEIAVDGGIASAGAMMAISQAVGR